MRAGRGLVLCAALLALACRGGKPEPEDRTGPAPAPAPVRPPDPGKESKPSGRVLWGPVPLSDPARSADGVSTALGVGQAGIAWIEGKDPGADVFFARVAGGDVAGTVAVTRGASAYPPTAVSWTGSEFALAWGDDRYRHVEIFVARVAYNGKLALAPRRFTQTIEVEDPLSGAFAADSSQSPTLAYYGGQVLLVWGGPGKAGRQQVYMTTISKAGKPSFDPTPLTSGLSNAVGMRLVSYEKGALLSYCVSGTGGAELYRVHLAGAPPEPAQPMRVATSTYVPCSGDHALAGEGSVIMWVRRDEDEGGAVEDRLVAQVLDGGGEFVGETIELPEVRLVKFPGKHHAPFDVLGIEGGLLAVAWVERVPDGSAALRVGVIDDAGRQPDLPFVVPTQADPTDPHLVESGQPGSVLLAWLDRPMGSKLRRVYVAGIAFE